MIYSSFFFFNDTATTEIYTLSLHDALPIYETADLHAKTGAAALHTQEYALAAAEYRALAERSEEHTSELQSPCNLVCRLLLEKKKKMTTANARQVDMYTTQLARVILNRALK